MGRKDCLMAILPKPRQEGLQALREVGIDPSEVIEGGLSDDHYLAFVVVFGKGKAYTMRERRDWPSEEARDKVKAAFGGRWP